MKAIIRNLAIAIASLSLNACSQFINKPDTNISIDGKIYSEEKTALPEYAQLVVFLDELQTNTDEKNIVSSKIYSIDGKQSPIEFNFIVPKSGIHKKRKYNLSAYIESFGEKIFLTEHQYPVLTDALKTLSVEMKMVSNFQE